MLEKRTVEADSQSKQYLQNLKSQTIKLATYSLRGIDRSKNVSKKTDSDSHAVPQYAFFHTYA